MEYLLRNENTRHAYFWATQSGAELDLFLVKGGKMIGYEFKFTSSPRVTKSMRTAMNDLGLEHLYVVYPGPGNFPLAERISALALADIS